MSGGWEESSCWQQNACSAGESRRCAGPKQLHFSSHCTGWSGKPSAVLGVLSGGDGFRWDLDAGMFSGAAPQICYLEAEDKLVTREYRYWATPRWGDQTPPRQRGHTHTLCSGLMCNNIEHIPSLTQRVGRTYPRKYVLRIGSIETGRARFWAVSGETDVLTEWRK